MSSLRNAVKRVAHKERAQPSARRGKGLLEKHGDYIERARDFQKKRKRIDRLREKAREKNPDEFYQAMVGKRTRDGIHVDESNHGEKLTNEEALLLKTQDAGYVEQRRSSDAKAAQKLKDNLHLLRDYGESGPPNKHTIFFDSAAEAAAFDPAEHFDTDASLGMRAFNRPTKQQLASSSAVTGATSKRDVKAALRRGEKAYDELRQREQRAGKMSKVLQKMAAEKARMGKGKKRKLKAEPGKAPQFKWKLKRQK